MISKNILFAWNSNSNFADPFAFCWPNKYENGAKWKCLMRQFSCKIGGMKVVRGEQGAHGDRPTPATQGCPGVQEIGQCHFGRF